MAGSFPDSPRVYTQTFYYIGEVVSLLFHKIKSNLLFTYLIVINFFSFYFSFYYTYEDWHISGMQITRTVRSYSSKTWRKQTASKK